MDPAGQRAIELQRAGDRDGAIALLRQALQARPGDLELEILLGSFVGGRGDHDEALRLFRWLHDRVKPEMRGTIEAATEQAETWSAQRGRGGGG